MTIPYLACMAFVASLNGLPPRVLPSIASVEGGRQGVASRNRDGSEDLGLMQVNTRWVNTIAHVVGLSAPQTRMLLLNDPCFNISAAGAILRTYLAESHGDLMRAIGDYHSHTRPLNWDYQAKVVRAAERLFDRAIPRADGMDR